MNLSYGVLPIAIHKDSDRSMESILQYLGESRLLPEDTLVVATGDFPEDNVNGERSLKIIRIGSPHRDQTGRRDKE
jgi:hypothetical protein